jgi:hypothetical protein
MKYLLVLAVVLIAVHVAQPAPQGRPSPAAQARCQSRRRRPATGHGAMRHLFACTCRGPMHWPGRTGFYCSDGAPRFVRA